MPNDIRVNSRHFLAIGAFLAVFAVFVWFLITPSEKSLAKRKLSTAVSIDDVKTIYSQKKDKLGNDEEFLKSVRDKLQTFGPSATQIQEIKQWLPPVHKNLNIILVPDLSYRLRDTVNNPGQPARDKEILSMIWSQFEKSCRLKMDTKDRLLVDVADPDQAGGTFRSIADSLFFDLSTFKDKSNRIYFKKVGNRFSENIQAMYKTAEHKTTGADYVYYFSQKLPERLLSSTLEDDYRNIVIILTDGYLEVTTSQGKSHTYTPSPTELKKLCGSIASTPGAFVYPIQTRNSSYPTAEVYLFEFNERKSGKNCDYTGLKQWWSGWFHTMHLANASTDNIVKREEAYNLSRSRLQTIF